MAEATAEQMKMPKHGEFCWMELATNNLEGCKNFYSEMFGWDYEVSDTGGMAYTEFGQANGERVGGMFDVTGQDFGGEIPPPHWLSYIAVDDCEASAAKCKELGGKVTMEPFDLPNVGKICYVQDPTGASFALVTLIKP